MATARIGFLPAALIAAAVAFAGWSVGQGVERFRMADRTVTVKGLVSGTPPSQNMWRWQSVQEFQYPLLEYLAALLADLAWVPGEREVYGASLPPPAPEAAAVKHVGQHGEQFKNFVRNLCGLVFANRQAQAYRPRAA